MSVGDRKAKLCVWHTRREHLESLARNRSLHPGIAPLAAASLDDWGFARSSLKKLVLREGSNALFEAGVLWASAIVGSCLEEQPVPEGTRVLVQVEPSDALDVDPEVLEEASIFVTAVANDDPDGALALWGLWPVTRAITILEVILEAASARFVPSVSTTRAQRADVLTEAERRLGEARGEHDGERARSPLANSGRRTGADGWSSR